MTATGIRNSLLLLVLCASVASSATIARAERDPTAEFPARPESEATAEALAEAVRAREAIMPTGVGSGIAIPHARIAGLAAPVAALAVLDGGVDFGAPDGEPARLAVLLVTPEGEEQLQLELVAEVARTLSSAEIRRRVAGARSFEELSRALRGEAR